MAKDIETHIFAHTGVEELEQAKIETELNYEHYKVHEPLPEDKLPLKWHEAAPCMGKKVAMLHMTASSDSDLKLIWSGNTWALLFLYICAHANTQTNTQRLSETRWMRLGSKDRCNYYVVAMFVCLIVCTGGPKRGRES